MFRTDRPKLLRAAPRRVADIAAQLVLAPKAVEDDLRRRLMSVNRGSDRITVALARCRQNRLGAPQCNIEGPKPS